MKIYADVRTCGEKHIYNSDQLGMRNIWSYKFVMRNIYIYFLQKVCEKKGIWSKNLWSNKVFANEAC